MVAHSLRLGSNVQSRDMPAEKMKIFLQVFGKMKQRVLWKFEDESMPNKPDNIMIKSWLPQSDILAHENVKVFITHGGLLGTQEGVYHAVPMLGMPIYCDQVKEKILFDNFFLLIFLPTFNQHLNMKKAVLSGYAINLHFQSLTEEILKNSLEELLYNPAYRNNIKHISQIFKDRPLNARDMATYWIEYVVRYRGAPHLRSAGLDLKWYEFYLLDVIAFVILTIALLIISLKFLLSSLMFKKPANHRKSKLN